MTPLVHADPPPPLVRWDIAPTTVINPRAGVWDARRKAWVATGLDDTVGRDHVKRWPKPTDQDTTWRGTPTKGMAWSGTVSKFDPVLAETQIVWHTRIGDHILDPFAGGPTRGIVAAVYGRHYTGIDISQQQAEANRAAYTEWRDRGLISGSAEWVCAPAQEHLPTLPDESADLVLTCPPYYNLETYTDDPADLSRMAPTAFESALEMVISETARILRPDRYAVWVTGDTRDRKTGILRRLPARVDTAHDTAGLGLVNEAIYTTPLGGRHTLIWRIWVPTRTLTRVHQHVHGYVKGDRRAAAARAATQPYLNGVPRDVAIRDARASIAAELDQLRREGDTQ